MKKEYSVSFEVYYDEQDFGEIMMAHHVKLHGPAPEGMEWKFHKTYSWEVSIKAVTIDRPTEKQKEEV